jgi:hypothetical protein
MVGEELWREPWWLEENIQFLSEESKPFEEGIYPLFTPNITKVYCGLNIKQCTKWWVIFKYHILS